MMLHRSTSSRRCRASRNMTNYGHTSTMAVSKGRRASVATDKPVDLPQTSPRGTIERQRSPQASSFVPDIDLETENDDEGVNYRPLLDRDQYGGSRNMLNQKFFRSPRNSLVPDDNYKLPRNGARSPRNSLVPDTALAPDTLYSSHHSLVFDAPLSPRNSLVPTDIARNRSPRNSLVPPTGSRTSLMSENGNPPPPSRSPRHSLVPNSSRSPRGSITNMELVDRSPQRSPRGSTASEYLNQSPRNSIVPYDVNRSSRGSIGMNDAHRGSIGGHEDQRSPRRSIDPETIDRTPRGSLSGLQEKRATKASLMTQDPRRASADQGINGNRTYSARQKEVHTGSVKSGGSTVQINLGYGPTTYEDSRRASSSVSQFSGDESRRLFTAGAKMPESTIQNKNIGVITYGSVVFQLKDANLEANNIFDFVYRALKVVYRTRVVTGCLVCLCTVPVLMLIFGWSFFKDCPKEANIPIYMVVGGTFGSLYMALLVYTQIRSRRPEMLTAPSDIPQISFPKLIIIVLSFFLMYWFVMGNYWILHIKWPPHKSKMHHPNEHCHEILYYFSVVHLGVVYVVFGITLIVTTVLASFRILAFPFF